MNRIFRVVWNDVRRQYMVCDENRVSHGKPKSVKNALFVAAVAAMFGMSDVALADPVPSQRVAVASSENVTLTNQSFSGLKSGITEDGGAVVNEGDLTVNGSETIFENNSAGTSGYTKGGAIYNAPQSSLSVSDAQFKNNKANDGGGAIAIRNNTISSAKIENATFTGNEALLSNGDGGAISVSKARVDITKSTFKENKADLGGAISGLLTAAANVTADVPRSDIRITGSSFEQNSGVVGGAIYAMNDLTVEKSVFTGNVAENSTDGGGAMFLGAESKTTITNTTFGSNESRTSNGGAIDTRKGDVANNTGAKLDITDSTFTANSAVGNGGALYNTFYNSDAHNGAVSVTGSTFGGDTVGTGNRAVKGGAIYNDGMLDKANNRAALYVVNSTFQNNAASQRGGAIYSHFGKITVVNSDFISNSASERAGAIYLQGEKGVQTETSVISNSRFEGNKSVTEKGNYGGAIGVAYMNLDIENSIFKNNEEISNTAGKNDGAGGALVIMTRNSNASSTPAYSTVRVSGTEFTGNKAGAGGAIANYDTLSVTNGSTFTGNIAKDGITEGEGGGALFLGSVTTTTIADTTFSGNRSETNDGGAIDTRNADIGGKKNNNSMGILDVNNSTFASNYAAQDGGAISNTFYKSSGNGSDGVTVAGSSFTGNSAGGNGGAIYNDGTVDFAGNRAKMVISDSSFTNNTAAVEGGAIYNGDGATITFTGNNIFSGNTVGTEGNKVANDIHNMGNIIIGSGTTTLASAITGTGSVNISGGTLAVNTINPSANKITISGTGTLKTKSDQVMQTGLNAEGTTTSAGGKLDSANITYNGGSLALTDAKYNLDYAKSVGDAIGNQTAVEMSGTLVNNAGQKLSDVNVNELPTNGVVLADVTGKTGGQELVVGSKAREGEQEQGVEGSLGVSSLDLGTADKVTVTGGKTLTLAGNGEELVKSVGNDGQQQNVAITLNTAGSALNLGSATTGKDGQLTGSINGGEGTNINVNGGNHTITGDSDGNALGITTTGNLNIAGGAGLQSSLNVNGEGAVNVAQGGVLQSDTVNLNGESTLAVGGTANVNSLNAGKDNTITVGNGQSQGSLNVANAKLNGATVFLDPAWQDGIGIDGASQGVIGSLGEDGKTIEGKLVVGQNSLLVLGDTSVDWTKAEFEKTGRKWGNGTGEITAALAIRSALTLDSTKGSVNVDGSLTKTPTDEIPNTATFAANSMLIVDASQLAGKAAIASTAAGTATVAGSAALHVANAKVGSETTILSGFTANNGVTIAEGGWTGDNLTSTDAMIKKLTLGQETNGTVTVTAEANKAEDILPGVLPANAMNKIWAADGTGVNGDGKGVNNTNHTNAGIAFLSKATDEGYLAHSDAVRTINGASLIAVAAGVQNTSIQAADAVNRALQDHLSLTSTVSQKGAPALHKTGADLWVNLLYQNSDSGGIKAGSFNANHDNNFGGIIVGSDYTWKDIGNGSFRVGGALNFGTGEGKSKGDFNYTKNDYDTYGLNLYGGWNNRNTNVVLDIGYLKVDNELKQNGASALGGDMKADVDTKVWTVGVKGEYQFQTDTMDITPHAGVRYLNVKTNSFDTRNNQGTVFHTNSDTQNLWQIPVGVTLSKDYLATSGWTVKPKFDISVIPTAGDKSAKTTVSVPGVGTSDSLSTDIMDSTSWGATLGLDMQKGNTRFGLKVGYQKSSDAQSRGAMLTFSRQFD